MTVFEKHIGGTALKEHAGSWVLSLSLLVSEPLRLKLTRLCLKE